MQSRFECNRDELMLVMYTETSRLSSVIRRKHACIDFAANERTMLFASSVDVQNEFGSQLIRSRQGSEYSQRLAAQWLKGKKIKSCDLLLRIGLAVAFCRLNIDQQTRPDPLRSSPCNAAQHGSLESIIEESESGCPSA